MMENKDKLLSKLIAEVNESPIHRIFQVLSKQATRHVLDGKRILESPKMTDEDVVELTLISERFKSMGLPYSALALSAETSEKLNSEEVSKLYTNFDSTSRLIPQGSTRTAASVTREKLVVKPFVGKDNWAVMLEEKLQKVRDRNRELMEEWRERDMRQRTMGPVEVPPDEEEEVESEDTSESSGDVPKTPVEPPSHRLSEIKASKLDDSQSAESDDSTTESASSSDSESEKTVSEKGSDNNSDKKSVEEEFDVVDSGSDSENSISF